MFFNPVYFFGLYQPPRILLVRDLGYSPGWKPSTVTVSRLCFVMHPMRKSKRKAIKSIIVDLLVSSQFLGSFIVIR